jgi:hypothetical protein
MVDYIIATEPEYASLPEDGPDNTLFKAVVRYCNIKYAMTEQIRSSVSTPHHEFGDVIYHHFRLKRREIRQDVNRWIEEADRTTLDFTASKARTSNPEIVELFELKGYRECLSEAVRELDEELMAL